MCSGRGRDGGCYVAGGRLAAAVGNRCDGERRRRMGASDGRNRLGRRCDRSVARPGAAASGGEEEDAAAAAAAGDAEDAAAGAEDDAAAVVVEERETSRCCWRMEKLNLIVWDPLPTWTVMIRWKIPPDLFFFFLPSALLVC
jgi:hypothetical protein